MDGRLTIVLHNKFMSYVSLIHLTWKLDNLDPTNVLSLSHTLTISDWFPGIHRKVIVKWQTALQKLVYSLKSYIYLPFVKFHISYVGKQNLMGIGKCQSFTIQIVQVTTDRNLQESIPINLRFFSTLLSTFLSKFNRLDSKHFFESNWYNNFMRINCNVV